MEIQLAGLLKNYYVWQNNKNMLSNNQNEIEFLQTILSLLSLLSDMWIPWLFVYLSLLNVNLNWWYPIIPDDVVYGESKIQSVYVFLSWQFVS